MLLSFCILIRLRTTLFCNVWMKMFSYLYSASDEKTLIFLFEIQADNKHSIIIKYIWMFSLFNLFFSLPKWFIQNFCLRFSVVLKQSYRDLPRVNIKTSKTKRIELLDKNYHIKCLENTMQLTAHASLLNTLGSLV